MDQSNSVTNGHDEPRIGELLVREGFISNNELEKALIIQKEEEEEANLPFEALLIKRIFNRITA